MKTGKITAKLRDAVPVCLMVEGKEVKRYKNIELPDMLKEVEMTDFYFNVHMDGKITFEIHYKPGVLPEVFPEAKAKVTRATKAAAKTTVKEPQGAEAPAEEIPKPVAKEETALAIIPESPIFATPFKAEAEMAAKSTEEIAEPTEEATTKEEPREESGTMEIFYNVTGPRRKELATAVGDFLGTKPKYMKAPTYAFAVESYTIDKNGTLTGAKNKALVEALEAQGFKAA